MFIFVELIKDLDTKTVESIIDIITITTDNDGNYVLNNNSSVNTVQYNTSRKDRIYPQLGLNKITFTVSSGANQSSLAFKITDQSGTELIGGRQVVRTALIAGSGLNNGVCPDGCTGASCFCNSNCKTRLGNGIGLGNQLILLENNNTALQDQLKNLNNSNLYLEKSIIQSTQPSVSGSSGSSMCDVHTVSSIAEKET